MTHLSVNLNKVALLRNARTIGIPSVTHAAEVCISAGAHGITVHPRPDQRHIRPDDVRDLAALLRDHPGIEFNIEGNPFPEFLDLVRQTPPHQCTLVPDTPGQSTSDHGWDLDRDGERLAPIIAQLRDIGVRVSLFMDVDGQQWQRARELGAERVELYTQPYAEAAAEGNAEAALRDCVRAASAAERVGLGVNAGHDLNLQNLGALCRAANILEVSIGHALIADALDMGLAATVRAYVDVLENANKNKS